MLKMSKLIEGAGGTDSHPGKSWDAIKDVLAGFNVRSVPGAIPLMRRPDGQLASSRQESADIVFEFQSSLFNYKPEVDYDTVSREVPQRDVCEELGMLPSMEEVLTAIKSMKLGKASGTDRVGTDHLKAIAELPTGKALLLQIARLLFSGAVVPPDWLISKLILLPKGGGKHNPGKWRSISLLQQCNKMVSSIISARLQAHLHRPGLGMESQSGFTRGRGTVDGFFNVQQALEVRKANGLDTWALMLDLKKAFDRVDRKLLWIVLGRFGVPSTLIQVIRKLYDGSTLKMKMEGAKMGPIPSTTGVKQGDNLAPILFLFVFQAAIEGMEWPAGCDPVGFQCSQDGVLWNRNLGQTQSLDRDNIKYRTPRSVTDFDLRESLYADDAGLLFGSHAAWQAGLVAIRDRLATFGLEMHYAHPGEDLESSKTVGIFFPAMPGADASTQAIGLLNEFKVGRRTFTTGRIPWVTSFKYLGSHLSSDLSDIPNTTARVRAASKAYGALSPILRDRNIALKVRSRLYVQLVIPVLLYGSECWQLSSESQRKLATFHHGCCRKIAGVSKWRQWERGIKPSEIAATMGPQGWACEQLTGFFDN